MSGPFKLKYKNNAFPFKTNEEEKQKERERNIKEAIRKDQAPPVTKETLQKYLEAVRGSKGMLS